MSNVKQLREQRANLIAEARKVMDGNEALDAEQRTSVDAMLSDADELRKDIARFEAIEADEKDMKASTDRRTELSEPQVQEERTELSVDSNEYRKAFLSYIRSGRRGMGRDEYRALEVGTNTEGGYITPTFADGQASMQTQIVETIDDASSIFGLSTVIPVSGDTTLPIESTLGTASWLAEEGSYTESAPAFGQVVLNPVKLSTMVKVSEELLADNAVNLESYLGRNMGRRFGNALEDAFVSGSGSGEPNGFDNTTTAGLTAASATAVTADELIDLFYNVKEGYRRSGHWVFNSTTTREIHQLKDANDQYLWQPALTGGQPDLLLGRPVSISDSCVDMATGTKSIFFGDFSYYYIAMRQGITLKRLDELYAETGQVGFYGSMRVDSELTLAESVHHIVMA